MRKQYSSHLEKFCLCSLLSFLFFIFYLYELSFSILLHKSLHANMCLTIIVISVLYSIRNRRSIIGFKMPDSVDKKTCRSINKIDECFFQYFIVYFCIGYDTIFFGVIEIFYLFYSTF